MRSAQDGWIQTETETDSPSRADATPRKRRPSKHGTLRRYASRLHGSSYKYLYLPAVLQLLFSMIDFHQAHAFVIHSLSWSKHQGTTTLWSSSSSSLPQRQSPTDVFCVNWEGCVADTVDWRIQTGMNVALQLWPGCRALLLPEQQPQTDHDSDAADDSNEIPVWLSNKLVACQNVLQETTPDVPVAAAYALAIRMFLEEQALDQGRSTGSRGKYGSQFHPRGERQSRNRNRSSSSSSRNSSRPLTVGEVAANWCDGAVLRETLPAKYRCPPSVLEQAVQEQQAKSGTRDGENVQVHTDVAETLVQAATDPSKRIIVTVSHGADLVAAETCLRAAFDSLGCNLVVVSNMEQALRSNCNSIALLVKSDDSVADVLLQCARTANQEEDEQCTVHVVESSWQALQREIPLFGDDFPRSGVGRTAWGSRLALVAADWAHSRVDSLERAAVMSPWTTLLSRQDLEELLTARIVPRQRER